MKNRQTISDRLAAFVTVFTAVLIAYAAITSVAAPSSAAQAVAATGGSKGSRTAAKAPVAAKQVELLQPILTVSNKTKSPVNGAAARAADEPSSPHAAIVKTRKLNASAEGRVRTIKMEVTGYCPCRECCGPNARGITASGRPVSYNHGKFVAADTDLLPFGTKLVVPGYNGSRPVPVADRGGAIEGRKLDLFFPTHEQALKWGRQVVTVTVVED